MAPTFAETNGSAMARILEMNLVLQACRATGLDVSQEDDIVVVAEEKANSNHSAWLSSVSRSTTIHIFSTQIESRVQRTVNLLAAGPLHRQQSLSSEQALVRSWLTYQVLSHPIVSRDR